MAGQSPYPVERTLLVTSALDVLMDSKFKNHERIETPQLVIPYDTPDASLLIRPTRPRPRGASTEASVEFLSDFAPQYKAGVFPEQLKLPQPFKHVPRL